MKQKRKAEVVALPLFHVVGYKVEASVQEFESGLGKQTYHSLIERKAEIVHRKNDHILLIQIYPMDAEFNPQSDRFTNIVCCEVSELCDVPLHMASHTVAESKYAVYTHKGPESELSRSYGYLYGEWMEETGHVPQHYDFEIWDERYHPESLDNEIDIFVALKG
ncbi:hypothetical protein BBD42_04065 [Paenibacillus sp. BIHB 4019]|uniref:AraC effector-binding domain-containing protein n=1 Tax=Paenibacillus sp. BIHB 4019 TaxID=1870819 RepID=A0A1B2DDE4_9BACL|nr:GyrI-like domain-containing protein [Paenibacillus sp. BIHB 4019]ANY65731.1 hypothetical protein BBD42_04065 [Paenibacillus sp. BIHB 4019]